jgi:hypothetical protein
MKICYISCYRDGTGYAHSAISHMLALDAAGADVVARPVKMTNTKGEVPEKVLEFEAKGLKNVDAVVQHNLPSEFVYKGGIPNIGLFSYETSGFPNTNWQYNLSYMDKIIVSSEMQKVAVKNTSAKLDARTHVLPHPTDTSKFNQAYDLMDFGVPKNCFKFYTISEFGKRKNLLSLLTAYYSEFDIYDNVLMVVKTHLPNRGTKEAYAIFDQMCNEVKESLGRFSDKEYYPKVALITQYLTDSQINSLHMTGDAFVSASHGEAICLPFVDAIGFGKPCIVPKHSAFLDYSCDIDADLLVDSYESVVTGVKGSPKGLYTSDEKWGNISLSSLGNKMRFAVENRQDLMSEVRVKGRKDYVQNALSFDAVGNSFMEILNAK